MTTNISTKRIDLIVYTRLYKHICVYVYVCVYLHVQVNRNMTTNIEEANRRIVNLQQQLQQENISARNNDAPATSRGEGIFES